MLTIVNNKNPIITLSTPTAVGVDKEMVSSSSLSSS